MYQVVFPKSVSEIKNEGQTLRHMVELYVEGILAGKYLIAFLRRTDSPNTPLLTLMLKDGKVLEAAASTTASRPVRNRSSSTSTRRAKRSPDRGGSPLEPPEIRSLRRLAGTSSNKPTPWGTQPNPRSNRP